MFQSKFQFHCMENFTNFPLRDILCSTDDATPNANYIYFCHIFYHYASTSTVPIFYHRNSPLLFYSFLLPPFLFLLLFFGALLNRFLSKIYFVYECIRSLFTRDVDRPPDSRVNSYGYSNYQGILERSDMEWSGQRCSPQFVNFLRRNFVSL